jgi:intracellular multiplication protein IcmC
MAATIAKSYRVLFIAILALMLGGCQAGINNDITQMLVNLQQQLGPIWQFLNALCWVLGICFVGIAIMKLKQYGQITVMMATHANLGPAMAYLLIGLGLLFIPTFMDTVSMSLWGYGMENLPSYDDSAGFSDIMIPVVQLIRVIGLFAFIRGWILLLRLGHQGSPPGTLSKGLLHMLGGIMAVNIVGTLDVLKATFGLT